LVHQFYPEYYTGTEKFILNMASMMQKLGNKTKVMTYCFYENSFFDEQRGNILLKEYTYKGLPVLALRHRKIPEDIHSALDNQELTQIAGEILAKEKPDIAHVGHPMRIGELIKAAALRSIPYLLTLTDFFLICPKYILSSSKGSLCAGPEGAKACFNLCPELPQVFLTQRLEAARDILMNAKRVISPSYFLASIFKKEYEDLDVKVINHGLSYSKIRENRKTYKKGDRLVFCYAGSLTRHKGIHVVIDAFKKINSDNIVLKIYGSGPDDFYVNKLREMAGKDKRIEFCGIFSEDEFSDVFSTFDIVIIPSLWYENYPLVLHEALACNIPVVASNVGGMAEKIEDGMNGYLFKIGNATHLKKVLKNIVDNPERINDLKRNIKGFMVPTVEQEAYAYEREYKRLEDERRKAAQQNSNAGTGEKPHLTI
jgi:glycosyltransferase involved in cell wall biosynthesis